MKPIFISRLNSILETPENAILYGKNGVVYSKIRNEKGFKLSETTIPYTHFTGAIETSSNPIIFSTDGINSAIGLYDVDTDTYIPILNDATLDIKLNFSTEGYIQGEARKNYLNELEITWLDTHNVPRFLNTSKPIPEDINLFKLFIDATDPVMTLTMTSGGGLKKGAYYVAVRYITAESSELEYSTVQGPLFAYLENYAGIGNQDTSTRSLKISLEGLDTNFSKVQLVIISNIEGVVTAKEIDELPIPTSGSLIYSYSNNTIGTDIALEEVLIPFAKYENAKAITQENDVLYLGAIKEKDYPNLQEYFIFSKINWVAEIVSIKDPKLKTGEKRTLKHGEVYAIYAVVKWKDGTVSDAYTIPGDYESPVTQTKTFWPEEATVPVTLSYDPVQWRTQIETQIWSFTAPNEGRTGGWINVEETYPSDPSFGPLANLQVRHHRMPTMRWCRNNLSGADESYGINKMSIFRLRLYDTNFPPEIEEQIDSIELYHAKRDYGNSLVLSQGILIPAEVGIDPEWHPNPTSGLRNVKINYKERLAGIPATPGPITSLRPPFFSGSSISTDINVGSINPSWAMIFGYVHAFVSPNTIKDKIILSGSPGIVINGTVETNIRNSIVPDYSHESFRDRVVRILDATLPISVTPGGSVSGSRFNSPDFENNFYIAEESFYVVNNQIHPRINNSKSEGKLILQTVTDGNELEAPWVYNDPEWEGLRHVDIVNTTASDLYVQFTNQELVRIGLIDNNGLCEYGGDTYIGEFAFNTNGVGDERLTEWKYYDGGNIIDDITNQIFRKFLIESNYNPWLRYQDPTNERDRFNLIASDIDRRIFKDGQESNFFNIPLGANAIGSILKGIAPFNVYDENVVDNPFKIIRSQKQARENKVNSWRKFLGLDYFETVKDKGDIINLQGFNGNLLIHHQYAIYQTVGKTTLQGDILSVTLGTGDIFQLEPQEAKSSKTGIGGLQHPLHSSMTDIGYIFVDIEKRVVYKVDEKGLQPLNGGLDTLLKESLKGIEGIPYNSLNGVTIGYDEEEARLLFSFLKDEQSLTFSMDISTMRWTYSHDYFPNAYINTRKKLINIKNNKIFRFNEGPFGVYHTEDIKPYYIDVPFINGSSFILNSISWRTIVEDVSNVFQYLDEVYNKTFTSVTIWNANQCTGKIDLISNNGQPLANNTRAPEYRWNFNKFVNLVKEPGVFLQNIFEDFRVIDSKLKTNIPWYQKDLILGDYVIIRFEFSNSENKQITVIDLDVDVSKSHR